MTCKILSNVFEKLMPEYFHAYKNSKHNTSVASWTKIKQQSALTSYDDNYIIYIKPQRSQKLINQVS